MSNEKDITDYSEARKWERFKSDAGKKGVYLIFDKLYILPGEPIPEKYGPNLSPHYRFISRNELRLKKSGKL